MQAYDEFRERLVVDAQVDARLGGDLGDQREVLQVLEIFEAFHGFLFERGGSIVMGVREVWSCQKEDGFWRLKLCGWCGWCPSYPFTCIQTLWLNAS